MSRCALQPITSASTRPVLAPPLQFLPLLACHLELNRDCASDPSLNHFLPATPCLQQTVPARSFLQAALPLASSFFFSSTSAVWSQTGAAHYAASNSFLDVVSTARQAAGLPGTSIQYGPFVGTGMAAGHVTDLAAVGLKGLSSRQVGLTGSISDAVPHCMLRAPITFSERQRSFPSDPSACSYLTRLWLQAL